MRSLPADKGCTLTVMQLSVVRPVLSATVTEKVQYPSWIKDPLTLPCILAMSPAGRLVKVQMQGYFPFYARKDKLTNKPAEYVSRPPGFIIASLRLPSTVVASILRGSKTRSTSSDQDLQGGDQKDILTEKEPFNEGRPCRVPLGQPIKGGGREAKVKEGLSSPITRNCTVQY